MQCPMVACRWGAHHAVSTSAVTESSAHVRLLPLSFFQSFPVPSATINVPSLFACLIAHRLQGTPLLFFHHISVLFIWAFGPFVLPFYHTDLQYFHVTHTMEYVCMLSFTVKCTEQRNCVNQLIWWTWCVRLCPLKEAREAKALVHSPHGVGSV